jgi:hypothetical protein
MPPGQLRTNLLVALRGAGGQPLAESVLVETIVGASPGTPRDAVRAQLRELERLQLLTAVHDPVLDQNCWALTTAGEARANQLR